MICLVTYSQVGLALFQRCHVSFCPLALLLQLLQPAGELFLMFTHKQAAFFTRHECCIAFTLLSVVVVSFIYFIIWYLNVSKPVSIWASQRLVYGAVLETEGRAAWPRRGRADRLGVAVLRSRPLPSLLTLSNIQKQRGNPQITPPHSWVCSLSLTALHAQHVMLYFLLEAQARYVETCRGCTTGI